MSRLETLEAQLTEAIEPTTRVNALNRLAEHVIRLDLARSFALADSAYQEAKQAQYLSGEASALRNRAVCRLIQADLEGARKDYELALAKARVSQNRDVEAASLLGLSTLCRKATNYTEAMSLLRDAWRIRQEQGDVFGEIAVLNNLGSLCIELGNYEEALYFLTRGLRIARENNDVEYEVFCLANVAGIKRDSGAYDEALSDYRLALELAERVDNRYIRPHVLAAMCETYLKQGKVEDALRVNEEALLLANAGEDRQIELTLLIHLGNICDDLGMPEAAEAAFVRAMERTQRLGDLERRLEALCQAGAFYLRQERHQEARHCFTQVHQHADAVGARRHLARACRALGTLATTVEEQFAFQNQAEQIEALFKKQVDEGRSQTVVIGALL